jgi:hypothetical protein
MIHFGCLNAVFLLIILSACAPNEPIWVIPGDLGTTHQWVGALPAAGSAKIARIRIRVTGMVPPSPSSGSREIGLTLTCTGPAATQVRWHAEPVEPDTTPNRSSDVACGEQTAVFVTYEHTDRQIVLDLPAGVSGGVAYTLTATVGMPY